MSKSSLILETAGLGDVARSGGAPEVPPQAADRTNAAIDRHTRTQVLVFSALFWIAMFALHTIQTSLADQPTDLRSIASRAALSVLGFFMCLPLGWVVQRSLAWKLSRRVVAVAFAGLTVAVVYATLGYWVWFHILLPAGVPYTPLAYVTIQSLYNLILFLTWSAFCATIYYAARLQERERSLLEARALAQEAQLMMLRYQINPHFLFNTLNAVAALVVTQQTEAADLMIGKLARFFRNALSRESSAKVTLGEEIRMQSEYLDIETTRFGDRLSFSVELEPGLETALVPHLILQPLVENAIKHGAALSESHSSILVRAARSHRRLLITVANDIPTGKSRLNRSGDGVGLANVARRLAAFYGREGNVLVRDRDERFVVELRIPLETTL